MPGQIVASDLEAGAEIERRLTELCVELACVSIFRIDPGGRIVFANEEACRSLGYTRDELLRLTVFDIDPRFTRAAWLAHREEVQETGRRRIETVHRRKDGTCFPVEVTVTRMNCMGRSFTFSLALDITERRRAEDENQRAYDALRAALAEKQRLADELRAAKERAEAATRAMNGVLGLLDARLGAERAGPAHRGARRFIAAMSHELRTPLNGVLGMLDILQDSPLSAEQRECVGVIRTSGEELSKLICDILDYARADRGQLPRESVPFDPRAMLEDLAALVAATCRAKGLEIVATADASVPRLVLGDAARLRHVLGHVVANAAKFTERGRVALRASLHDPSHRPRLILEIEDTGIGIAPEQRASLFEGFDRAGRTAGAPGGGTGLGLTIASRLVQLMEGDLSVESEPGRGSLFRVRIPVDVAALGAGVGEHRAEEGARRAGTAPLALNVLVVDDNAVNRKVLAAMLRRMGHRPVTAESGLAALDLLASVPFHLVLMDGHMPGLDGFETTRRIRAGLGGAAPDIPVIAVTAAASPEDAEAFYAAGANGLLGKPVSASLLDAEIERLFP